MPYSYPNNVPPPAKNWSEAEKKRCVKAANRALREGKSEEQAVFACIGAAGKSFKQVDEDEYEEAVEDGLNVFQSIVTAYFGGIITLSVLRQQFSSAIERHYTRLMVLGLEGREPTVRDLEFLNRKLDEQEALLRDFVSDLGSRGMSEGRALWRAGMYAPSRETYIFYTVPNAVVSLMEGLPGEICLGNGLCGCYLDVTFDDEGNARVEWIIDPQKESCENCLDMAGRSPFLFSREEIESVG